MEEAPNQKKKKQNERMQLHASYKHKKQYIDNNFDWHQCIFQFSFHA